jgi:hypothetical protein
MAILEARGVQELYDSPVSERDREGELDRLKSVPSGSLSRKKGEENDPQQCLSQEKPAFLTAARATESLVGRNDPD